MRPKPGEQAARRRVGRELAEKGLGRDDRVQQFRKLAVGSSSSPSCA